MSFKQTVRATSCAMVLHCWSHSTPTLSCTPPLKLTSVLTDDYRFRKIMGEKRISNTGKIIDGTRIPSTSFQSHVCFQHNTQHSMEIAHLEGIDYFRRFRDTLDLCQEERLETHGFVLKHRRHFFGIGGVRLIRDADGVYICLDIITGERLIDNRRDQARFCGWPESHDDERSTM